MNREPKVHESVKKFQVAVNYFRTGHSLPTNDHIINNK